MSKLTWSFHGSQGDDYDDENDDIAGHDEDDGGVGHDDDAGADHDDDAEDAAAGCSVPS